jgi:hypothetical protein
MTTWPAEWQCGLINNKVACCTSAARSITKLPVEWVCVAWSITVRPAEEQCGMLNKWDLPTKCGLPKNSLAWWTPLTNNRLCYCSGHGLTAVYCPRVATHSQDGMAPLCPSINIYSSTTILWEHICMGFWHLATDATADRSFWSDTCQTAWPPSEVFMYRVQA